MKLTKVFAIVPILAMSLLVSCGVKDADIQAKVTETLKAVPGVSAEVKDGVLTLSGNVPDDAAKTAAETAVKAEKGVKSVVNNITVTPATPAAAAPITISPDEVLTKAVVDATKDYPGVTAAVKDGVISLKGTLTVDKWKRLKMSLDALSPKKVDASGISIAK
ncbi:MAG: transport-associated protein [Mucilaginibacter sp.]|nr:transport-associated protein [Mucilaginibacter sp.]